MEAVHAHNISTFTPTLNPDMLSTSLTPPPTVDPSSTTIIKMEDLQSTTLHLTNTTATTPGPSPTEGKPAKKRKSWGQVLPEPKTNLPPRKRAKTDDEKEQRRIERVKRNRLAAHNSRERKRQEVEYLQAEKDQLADDLRKAQEAMARMAAELKAFRQRHPSEAPSSQYESNTPVSIDNLDTLLGSDTICPRQASFPSPESLDSLDSPRDDSCQPETPAYSESNVEEFDQTRYPAAISSHDLQCQSDSTRHSLSPWTSNPQAQAWHLTMAFISILNLHLSSMRSLSTFFSTLTASSTPQPTDLQAFLTALLKTSSLSPSWRPTPSQPLMAFLTQLAQNPSICSPTLAQLWLATSLASQRRSNAKVSAWLEGVEDGSTSRGLKLKKVLRRQPQARLRSRRRGISLTEEMKKSLSHLGKENHDLGHERSMES